jgi:hypothetical protein
MIVGGHQRVLGGKGRRRAHSLPAMVRRDLEASLIWACPASGVSTAIEVCRRRPCQSGAIGRRAARRRGRRQLRRGVDRRPVVGSTVRTLRPRPVWVDVRGDATCAVRWPHERGRAALRELGQPPKSRPRWGEPRSRPPRATHGTENRSGPGFRRRGGTPKGGPPPSGFREPPTVPETEIAVVRIRRVGREEPEQGSPLINLVRRRVQIGFALLLAVVAGRVGNEARALTGSKASRAKGHQPRPRKVARRDPTSRQ